MKEVDVARPVVEWLRGQGYEVYQEVAIGESVADIVAVKDGQPWVVETKTSLSWDLLAQANRRKNWAPRVSVAVPARRWKYNTRVYMERLFQREGFGMLCVRMGRIASVYEQIVAPVSEKKPLWCKKLMNSLHEAQKDFLEAGTAGGGHWTPYKQTCIEVLNAVTANPGIGPKDLVGSISHHYASDASARSALAKRGRQDLIPGVEVRKEGNRVRFYPRGSP